MYDLHATMLHLLGVDHKKLTFRFGGRDMRLDRRAWRTNRGYLDHVLNRPGLRLTTLARSALGWRMNDVNDQWLQRRARGIRVIGLAMIAGTLVGSGIMIGMHAVAFQGKPMIANVVNGIPIITFVGIFIAIPALALSLVLPARLRSTAVSRLTAAGENVSIARLLQTFASAMLIGLALAEASALMGSILFLVEGHWLSIIPVGVGILAMIWMLPSESAIREWVADQAAELPAQSEAPGS